MSATYTGYRASTAAGWYVKRNLATGVCEVYDPQDRLVAQRRRWWTAMTFALQSAHGECSVARV